MGWFIAAVLLVGVAWWLWARSRAVGGWRELLGGSTPRRAPISTSISISERELSIDALEFHGPCLRSPNRKFTLGWSDGPPGAGGQQGHVILLIDKQVILHRRLAHPAGGAVSNIGTFAVADRRDGADDATLFHVLSPYGDSLARCRLRGSYTACGISTNGRFAICHTLVDPEADAGGLLHFIVLKLGPTGLKPGGVAWKVETWPDTPTGFDIDIVRRLLTVRFGDGSSCVFSFDGELIETEIVGADSEETVDDQTPDDGAEPDADGRDLVEQADQMVRTAPDDEDSYLEAQALLEQAVEMDLPARARALALRRLGEIAEFLEQPDEAAQLYEEALELNPKVGVKSRLARLRKAGA